MDSTLDSKRLERIRAVIDVETRNILETEGTTRFLPAQRRVEKTLISFERMLFNNEGVQVI